MLINLGLDNTKNKMFIWAISRQRCRQRALLLSVTLCYDALRYFQPPLDPTAPVYV